MDRKLGPRAVPPDGRYTRPLALLHRVAVTLALIAAAGAQDGGAPPPTLPAANAVAPVVIPDGTLVNLRFAQPVSSIAPGLLGRGARKGDTVRLVVAQDVCIDGKVVLARGAQAEATVTRAIPPNSGKIPTTGLSLIFEGALSVDGEMVALRSSKKGKSKSFDVEAFGEHGGTVARPVSLARNLFGATTALDFVNWLKRKPMIPLGTRIVAYVVGPAELVGPAVAQAQSRFPLSNPNAVLTIYRGKGGELEPVAVECDQGKVASLGPFQHVNLELAPGPHRCRAATLEPVTVVTAASGEYFLRLRVRGSSASELKLVDALEGEDAIARSELVDRE